MIALRNKNLSPIGRQETKKKVYQCMNKNGEIKVFEVSRLIDIPIQWRKDPLMLGFTK